MAVLIDSSIFIAAERRGVAPERIIALVGDESAALASITASELLAGVYRAESFARRKRREEFVEAILEVLPTFPFDLQTARVHARLLAQLAAAGQPIGAHDLLIGATALAYDSVVLTDNIRDFKRIPDLIVWQSGA
jgi:predicted nucleic acid-binding protein